MLVYTAYNFDFLRWGYGTEPFDEKAEVQKGLTALAAELGVSLQHLSADIKDKFGMTF